MQVDSRHPTCNFMLEVEKDQAECLKRLGVEEEAAGSSKGYDHSQTLKLETTPSSPAERELCGSMEPEAKIVCIKVHFVHDSKLRCVISDDATV